MHSFNCPCGACGRRESEWRRSEAEAIDQLAHVFDAGLDDFLDESISEACDAVGYDGDRDDEFRCAALHELIGVAVSALFELAGERGSKAEAQAVLRLVASEAGITDSIAKAELGHARAIGEQCGRIGVAVQHHPAELPEVMRRNDSLELIGRALDEMHVALRHPRPQRIDFSEFARCEAAFVARESAA